MHGVRMHGWRCRKFFLLFLDFRWRGLGWLRRAHIAFIQPSCPLGFRHRTIGGGKPVTMECRDLFGLEPGVSQIDRLAVVPLRREPLTEGHVAFLGECFIGHSGARLRRTCGRRWRRHRLPCGTLFLSLQHHFVGAEDAKFTAGPGDTGMCYGAKDAVIEYVTQSISEAVILGFLRRETHPHQ